MACIQISWNAGKITARLNDSENAKKLVKVLPYTSSAHTWGKEIYFEVPVYASLTPDARDVVEPGTVCFWVEGRAVAIPFGPTPISQRGESRLISRVNILGKVEGDPKVFRSVKNGTLIHLELV